MSAPWEYVELTLWKYLYECTPVELVQIIEQVGVQRVLLDLAMLNIVRENEREKLRK